MTDEFKANLARKDERYAQLFQLPGPNGKVPSNNDEPLNKTGPPEPCYHRGAQRTNPASPLRTWHECEHPDKPLGELVCACRGCGPKCVGYRPDFDSDTRPLPAVVTPEKTGIVVGHYGLPGLARLQHMAIRRYAGNVPVLFADDGSGRDADFEAIADADSFVTFWPSCERRGHYAGDLSAFWKGLQWAHRGALDHLVKLSQRFIWRKPNWLADAVAKLKNSGESTLMQACVDNGVNLFVRTECMMFNVARWIPLLNEFNYVRLLNPTELRIWHLVHSQFNEMYCEWSDLPVNRYEPAPGTLWHGTHTDRDYKQFAESLGVNLDADFYVEGHQSKPGWVKG